MSDATLAVPLLDAVQPLTRTPTPFGHMSHFKIPGVIVYMGLDARYAMMLLANHRSETAR